MCKSALKRANARASVHVEVRGQLLEVTSLLPSRVPEIALRLSVGLAW